MNYYDSIIEQSRNIDWSKTDISGPLNIMFPVPRSHVRSKIVAEYFLTVSQISSYHFLEDDLILCDESLKSYLTGRISSLPNILFLSSTESDLKTVSEADKFLEAHKNKGWNRIVSIGGGILINFEGYVAERLGIDLVYVPTSVIAMSDASMGGKVRLNSIEGSHFNKHAYKSFYEPSAIVLDPMFLAYLSDDQIREGLAEVIKHATYQSPRLAEYLISDRFDPFTNKESLLRAILWTADLKRTCLEVDPEESHEGSYKILRAAHDISDRLEEESRFSVSHGEAVEKAMLEDLKNNTEALGRLVGLYKKLGIGYMESSV